MTTFEESIACVDQTMNGMIAEIKRLNEEKHALLASNLALLAAAKLLEKTIEYEIRRSEKNGDDEGAILKTATLIMVRAAIAKAERLAP